MEKIRYKGNGEHSVNELELIIEQQAEELHLIKSGKKQLSIHGVSNTEGKFCPHCGKCNMNYDTDGSYLNWECKTFP